MEIYVIYDHPSDYPNDFVCVLWRDKERVNVAGTAKTLEGARKFVPNGFMYFPPYRKDDPKIVETWI
jgi:hypothetical protein